MVDRQFAERNIYIHFDSSVKEIVRNNKKFENIYKFLKKRKKKKFYLFEIFDWVILLIIIVLSCVEK